MLGTLLLVEDIQSYTHCKIVKLCVDDINKAIKRLCEKNMLKDEYKHLRTFRDLKLKRKKTFSSSYKQLGKSTPTTNSISFYASFGIGKLVNTLLCSFYLLKLLSLMESNSTRE